MLYQQCCKYKIIFLCLLFLTLSIRVYAKDTRDNQASKKNLLETSQEVLSKIVKYREPKTEWLHILEGFRKAHHLNLNVFYTKGTWDLIRFSSIKNKQYSFYSTSYKFYYTYHLRIISRFGYFLGTSLGMSLFHSKPKDINRPNVYMLPGLVGGFVINISSVHRILTGVDLYLERWDNLKDQDNIEDSPTINITARSWNMFAGFDMFYSFKHALRIEYHQKQSFFSFPKERVKDVDTQAKINKMETWIGLGIVYHII